MRWTSSLGALLLLCASVQAGESVVATGQTVHPEGEVLAVPGRPVDLAVSPDGGTVFVKKHTGLAVLDVKSWRLRQDLPCPPGGSMHGIAVTRDGRYVYLTTSGGTILRAAVDKDGNAKLENSAIRLPDKSFPCGLALGAGGRCAYVALCSNGSLALVDLDAGKVRAEISVGVAPYDVALSPDGATAYVSNWGGRRPGEQDRTANSAGAGIDVDEHGIPCSGTVSKVDLARRKVLAHVEVGLHPSGLAITPDGSRLYVANASSDTVSVIDTAGFRVVQTLSVRPDPSLPFGSIPCALALSKDGHVLFAANGGNNAVAVISVGGKCELKGFIPAGWFPGAVATDGGHLFIANIKGDARTLSKPGYWNTLAHRGTVSKVDLPSDSELAKYTHQAVDDAMVPQALQAFEKAQSQAKPVPVPIHAGEPSLFEHVVYVIKENRTYDQLLGDLKQANGDPNLCIYGRNVTPNHHALAEQFVILDNYYCNGVVSADGHQWATQGITSNYVEKSFGGWRSYFFGTDPMAFAPTPFIWDSALLHGLSFRNYGEFAWSGLSPASATWIDAYTRKASFKQSMSLAPLEQYTDMKYAGWNLKISDQLRIDRFIEEFRQFEKNGKWPALLLVYLPQDHTSGVSPHTPSPRATWPTTTSRSAGWSRSSPPVATGPRPASSSTKTTPERVQPRRRSPFPLPGCEPLQPARRRRQPLLQSNFGPPHYSVRPRHGAAEPACGPGAHDGRLLHRQARPYPLQGPQEQHPAGRDGHGARHQTRCQPAGCHGLLSPGPQQRGPVQSPALAGRQRPRRTVPREVRRRTAGGSRRWACNSKSNKIRMTTIS